MKLYNILLLFVLTTSYGVLSMQHYPLKKIKLAEAKEAKKDEYEEGEILSVEQTVKCLHTLTADLMMDHSEEIEHLLKNLTQKELECCVNNYANSESKTPLYKSVKHQKFNEAKILCNYGADISSLRTLLIFSESKSTFIERLLEYVNDKEKIAHFMITNSRLIRFSEMPYIIRIKMLNTLICSNFNTYADNFKKVFWSIIDSLSPEELNGADDTGNTPLSYAIDQRNWFITNLLIQNGGDLQKIDKKITLFDKLIQKMNPSKNQKYAAQLLQAFTQSRFDRSQEIGQLLDTLSWSLSQKEIQKLVNDAYPKSGVTLICTSTERKKSNEVKVLWKYGVDLSKLSTLKSKNSIEHLVKATMEEDDTNIFLDLMHVKDTSKV